MVGQRLCTSAAAAAAARCNICRHRLSLSRCRLSAIAIGRQQTVLCLPAVARCAAVVLDGGNWGLGLRPWPLCVEPAPHMHCPSVPPAIAVSAVFSAIDCRQQLPYLPSAIAIVFPRAIYRFSPCCFRVSPCCFPVSSADPRVSSCCFRVSPCSSPWVY